MVIFSLSSKGSLPILVVRHFFGHLFALRTSLQGTYLDRVFDFFILAAIKEALACCFCNCLAIMQAAQLFGN